MNHTTKLELTDHARNILDKRYLLRDNKGKIVESPIQLFQRVARCASEIESKWGNDPQNVYESFLSSMLSLDFLPNTPALINANTDFGQYAACFVLPIEDSVEKIMQTAVETSMIQKNGGGVGFSFSNIRPEGDYVNILGNIASGPVPFLQIFNSISSCIKQSGRRHGANIGVLRIDHPDIEKFIQSKDQYHPLSNFNISIGITDEFMRATEQKKEFPLINPATGEIEKTVNPYNILKLISKMTWKTGDPGIIFLDRINEDNPTPKLGHIEATNPCGELPLLPYESCIIGALNLSQIVTTNSGGINWKRLQETINIGVRFLDNLITANRYLIPEIEEKSKLTRKIGLGLMGWADLLIKLNLPYDSEKARFAAEDLMEFINFHAKATSINLAKERGKFAAYSESIYDINPDKLMKRSIDPKNFFLDRPDLDWDYLTEQLNNFGIRNATVTTIAPTGSLSIIAGVSGGIEPIYTLSRTEINHGKETYILNDIFSEIMRKNKYLDQELIEEVGKIGSLANVKHLPDKICDLFKTAHEIAPENHVKMHASFQKFVDNSVSKTVNVPNKSSVEDILKIYKLAYDLGCKGETIYRDGSRKYQPSYIGISEELIPKPKPVPEGRINAVSYSIDTPSGRMSLFFREINDNPFDIFVVLGRSGMDITAFTEAIGRLLSLALRYNIPVNDLAENLMGLGGKTAIGYGEDQILSVPDAIGKKLREEYLDDYASYHSADFCPRCNNISLEHSEGCLKCGICGYERC